MIFFHPICPDCLRPLDPFEKIRHDEKKTMRSAKTKTKKVRTCWCGYVFFYDTNCGWITFLEVEKSVDFFKTNGFEGDAFQGFSLVGKVATDSHAWKGFWGWWKREAQRSSIKQNISTFTLEGDHKNSGFKDSSKKGCFCETWKLIESRTSVDKIPKKTQHVIHGNFAKQCWIVPQENIPRFLHLRFGVSAVHGSLQCLATCFKKVRGGERRKKIIYIFDYFLASSTVLIYSFFAALKMHIFFP